VACLGIDGIAGNAAGRRVGHQRKARRAVRRRRRGRGIVSATPHQERGHNKNQNRVGNKYLRPVLRFGTGEIVSRGAVTLVQNSCQGGVTIRRSALRFQQNH
jgi:hypothetical protein